MAIVVRLVALAIAVAPALAGAQAAAPAPRPPIPVVAAAASPLVADVPGVRRAFVQVPGARLQWLDFGGRGETVVLLAGLGNSAWSYSAFGPALAREGFRVVALTRRAHGESEAPAAGYGLDTLAADVVAFLDSLGVRRAHLVGHSLAGAELTRLAARHPDRVGRLVYLDAAYDRQAQMAWMDRDPDPGPPAMTDADRASPAAYLAYQRRARPDLAKAWGPAVERDYLASLVKGSDGTLRWRTPLARYGAMLTATAGAPPEYAAVRAPSLAIYARGPQMSASLAERLAPTIRASLRDSVLAFERDVVGAWTDASIAQFRAAGGARCVVEMDAIHHVHLQREREVVALVRDFLRGRPVSCR
ncbi:alpha/beta fold hydrolase [Roseisolibacter agri]|uniref:AB hydrolase-1 domain-containing protein n=1 Tax=Roseisolibacter agri TaxID=2014610 RepID=A0AA37QAK4_9BACT|nr:alpha/beta hydrolase [Roseisolibacter agri]GLC26777.1 hypothetical protein rosag_32900 [Roseisolibacter agri]